VRVTLAVEVSVLTLPYTIAGAGGEVQYTVHGMDSDFCLSGRSHHLQRRQQASMNRVKAAADAHADACAGFDV
jgi:hypothetical protein